MDKKLNRQENRAFNQPSSDPLNDGMIQDQSISSQNDTISLSSIFSSKSKTKTLLEDEQSYDFRVVIPQLLKSLEKNQQHTPPNSSIKDDPCFDKTKTVQIKGKKGKLYDEICPICLQIFQNQKGLLKCDHQFCFSCIHEWSRSSTVCPCCRSKFQKIIKKNQETSQTQIHEVQAKEFQFREEDYLVCYNCGRGDNEHVLLVCDSCDFHCCHIYCDESLMDHIPEGDWYCKYCAQRLESDQLNTSLASFLSSSTATVQNSENRPVANRTRSRLNPNSVRIFQRLRRRSGVTL